MCGFLKINVFSVPAEPRCTVVSLKSDCPLEKLD